MYWFLAITLLWIFNEISFSPKQCGSWWWDNCLIIARQSDVLGSILNGSFARSWTNLKSHRWELFVCYSNDVIAYIWRHSLDIYLDVNLVHLFFWLLWQITSIDSLALLMFLNYLGQGSHPLAEVISSNLATHSGPLFLRFHVHFGWRFWGCIGTSKFPAPKIPHSRKMLQMSSWKWCRIESLARSMCDNEFK